MDLATWKPLVTFMKAVWEEWWGQTLSEQAEEKREDEYKKK